MHSFHLAGEDFNGNILPNKPVPSPALKAFYLDSGGQPEPDGDDYIETKTVLATMQDKGYTLDKDLFYYWDEGGQHSESYWGDRFWVPMTELYPIQMLSLEEA